MISSIRKFWRRLENNVHPDDELFFRESKHIFNLDFPPPAFIGDVGNAPVVLLDANGGYSATKTPAEFPHDQDRKEYIEWLKGERRTFPRNLSCYYTQHSLAKWLECGTVAIVNAVAYRSQKAPGKKLVKWLPSLSVHQNWLANELLPAAKNNQRFVVAHRWVLWNLTKADTAHIKNVIYSTNPVSPHPATSVVDEVRNWLQAR